MKFQFPANNFTSGEWSEKMIARTDTDQYAHSAESLENVIVQMQGGAFKRPGFSRINLDTDAQGYLNGATNVRIFPWNLSDGSRYLLVVTNDRPVSGTNKWFVYSEANFATHLLSVSTAFDFPDFPEGEVDKMQFCQVGDILFLTTPSSPPRFLRKEGSDFYIRPLGEYYVTVIASSGSGSITSNRGSWKSYPYGQFNSAGVGGTVTVTGTFTFGGIVTLESSDALFETSMSGPNTYMKFTAAGSTGAIRLTAVTDSKHATGSVLSELPGASGTVYGSAAGTAYEMSAWNQAYGFPRTVTAFQGRLLFGGNKKYPDTIWGSRIGQVFDFMEVPFAQDAAFDTFGSDNTRPFTLTPNSKESSNIRCLSSSKMLAINTDRSEIVAYGSNGALGPNDVNLESSTSFGSESVQPVRINNYLTFVQRGGRKLRDIIFSFDEYQYKSNDLTFVSDHLTAGDPMREIVSVEMGSSVLFARTFAGKLISVTLDRDYQVNAWAHHNLGGTYNGGVPQVISLCTLPAASNITTGFSSDYDSLFMLVKRTVNGSTVVSLEKMGRMFDPADTIQTLTMAGAMFPEYLDHAHTLINTVAMVPTFTTTFTFANLANETLSVIADGAYIGEYLLDNAGVLTLPAPAKAVLVGYKYTMTIKPSPIEQGVQIGTPQGVQKRSHEVYIRLWKTAASEGTYGIPGNMYNIGVPSANFSGDLYLKMPPGYSRKYEVMIQSTNPIPFNVLAMIYQGMAYD